MAKQETNLTLFSGQRQVLAEIIASFIQLACQGKLPKEIWGRLPKAMGVIFAFDRGDMFMHTLTRVLDLVCDNSLPDEVIADLVKQLKPLHLAANFFAGLQREQGHFYDRLARLSLIFWGFLDEDELAQHEKGTFFAVEELRSKTPWQEVLLGEEHRVEEFASGKFYTTRGERLLEEFSSGSCLCFMGGKMGVYFSPVEDLPAGLRTKVGFTRHVMTEAGVEFVVEARYSRDNTSPPLDAQDTLCVTIYKP